MLKTLKPHYTPTYTRLTIKAYCFMYIHQPHIQALANYSWNNSRIIGAKFTNENNRYIFFQKSRIIGTMVHTSVDRVNYKEQLRSFGVTVNLRITYIYAESAINFFIVLILYQPTSCRTHFARVCCFGIIYYYIKLSHVIRMIDYLVLFSLFICTFL